MYYLEFIVLGKGGGGYIQVVIQLNENDFFTKCYGENNKWYYYIISV